MSSSAASASTAATAATAAAKSFLFLLTKKTNLGGRNKDLMMTKSNFSTWDPRKLGKPGAADPLGPQYDEIPYGDVPPPHIAGRGVLPDVPAEYSQVPMVPARMGKTPADPTSETAFHFLPVSRSTS